MRTPMGKQSTVSRFATCCYTESCNVNLNFCFNWDVTLNSGTPVRFHPGSWSSKTWMERFSSGYPDRGSSPEWSQGNLRSPAQDQIQDLLRFPPDLVRVPPGFSSAGKDEMSRTGKTS